MLCDITVTFICIYSVFDYHHDDVYACVTDIDTGHSYCCLRSP